jgi:hypothetical protein
MVGKLVMVVGALLLALPSAAQAATFCVNTGPGCSATLQQALAAADADTSAPTDRVELGPGDYAGPFTADDDNSVEIVGAGRGTTVLTAAGDATVISLAAPSSSLRSVTVRPGTGIGVRLTSGGTPALLENMTVEMAGGGAGVQVAPGTTLPGSATLRHVTLAGGGTGTGLEVTASASSAASATLSNSVITRFAVPIRATDGACPVEPCTALATVTTDYSAYDPTTVASTRPLGVSVAGGTPAPVSAAPRLDEDLRPRYDSPLIDAADPAGGGTTDASGAPRVVDGDGTGGARSDIGALEYQRRAPGISASGAAPQSALAGTPVAFSATAADPDDEPLTAAWSFSDGGSATGLSTSHTFAAPGAATATLTVTDPTGLKATATVPVTITAAPPPPPPGGGDPGPRARAVARVVPDAVRLRAIARRDRRPPFRFRLRGRVVLPAGIATAGCMGGVVRLAIRAGKRRLTRSAKVAADCSFRLTLKLGRKRSKRVVVTPQFLGTAALTPRDGTALRLRAG